MSRAAEWLLCMMIWGQAGAQRETQGPVSGLIPTGRESDHESPMSRIDIHVIGLQDRKEQESSVL